MAGGDSEIMNKIYHQSVAERDTERDRLRGSDRVGVGLVGVTHTPVGLMDLRQRVG